MKHLDKTHHRLLTLLFKSSGRLDSYTLFKRSKLSFSEFSKAVMLLISEEYITEDDNHVSMSDKGKKHMLGVTTDRHGERPWRSLPDKYKLKLVSIDEPYIPDIKLLDKKTFKI